MEGSPSLVVFLAGTKVCTACNRRLKTGTNRQRKGGNFRRFSGAVAPWGRPPPSWLLLGWNFVGVRGPRSKLRFDWCIAKIQFRMRKLCPKY